MRIFVRVGKDLGRRVASSLSGTSPGGGLGWEAMGKESCFALGQPVLGFLSFHFFNNQGRLLRFQMTLCRRRIKISKLISHYQKFPKTGPF